MQQLKPGEVTVNTINSLLIVIVGTEKANQGRVLVAISSDHWSLLSLITREADFIIGLLPFTNSNIVRDMQSIIP